MKLQLSEAIKSMKHMAKKPSTLLKRKSKNSGSEKKEYFVQDLIGIDRIINNVVFMTDGTICGILEVLPINFYHKDILERNKIIQNFESVLKICPDHIKLKVRSEDANINKTLANIAKHMQEETDPVLKAQTADHIRHIKQIRGAKTLCYKFYFIYEYPGDSSGHESNDLYTVLNDMGNLRKSIEARITACGNVVINSINDFTETCDILYKHFNPVSSITESVYERDTRINQDLEVFNSYLPENIKRVKNIPDTVLPRTVDLSHSGAGYLVMDGQYHTYLSLRDNGYRNKVLGGWIDALPKGRGIDYDIILKKIPKQKVLSYMPQMGRISEAISIINRGDRDKEFTAMEAASNIYNITESLKKKDEDLWNMMVIITIRSNSYQTMKNKRDFIVKELRSQSMFVNDSFLTVSQYFRYTMPLITTDLNMLTSIFARDRRNILTSASSSLYCFTAYEIFDENGYVMGTNADNNSLVAINNFNTSRYSNGNIMLIGTSGSGKTFTENMLAYRMRMYGTRVIFILPVKGYEDYYSSTMNIHGSFITLSPSSDTCINIMDIRPAVSVKKKGIVSLLSYKITSLDVFVKLLMGNDERMTIEEENELASILVKLYADFGITNDNESIWRDRSHTATKDMPTLGDLYSRLIQRPSMKRIASVVSLTVTGDCRSLNGQTNVDLSNKYIVFNVDGNAIKERLYPAFLYIAYDLAYSMAKESDENFDAIFLDEVWKMMINEACAKQVMEMVKLIRAYAGCVVIATQDIEDFINRTHGFGSAVINNTKLKLLLNMEPQEIEMVSQCMKLSPDDAETIQGLKHQALLYSNGDKVVCNLIASDREIKAFTTDPNIKRAIAAEKRKRAKPRKRKPEELQT